MMSNSNDAGPENRMMSFKNRGNMQQDELRRRREDVAVEIRKQKREESLAKRRNMAVGAQADASEDEDAADGPTTSLESSLPEMMAVLFSLPVSNKH
jgi:importin subunit alpha-1